MSRWPRVPLGDVCDVVGGGTPSRGVDEYFGGPIPWATPTDVTALGGLYISQTKETITEAGLANSSAKLLPVGSVLLTSRATIGFTAVTKVPVATNQGFANLVCGEQINSDFIALYLPTQKSELIRLAGGTTFKEISKSTLKRIEIPLPPLDEQRRIVAILNSAQRIRRLRREAIAKARELIPALFIQMFGDPATNPMGWPVVAMSTLVERMEGGKNIAAGSEQTGEGSLRILKVSAVTSGVFNAEESKPAPDGFKPPASYFVRKGDLLFSRANTELLVGATAFVESEPENILLPDKLWRFVWAADNVVQPYYMLHYLKAPTTRQEISKRATGTSGSMKNISQAKLKTLPVMVPPFAAQQTFATRVTEIQSLITRLEQQATNADALVQSLMSRFFD